MSSTELATTDAALAKVVRETGAELSLVQNYFAAFAPHFDELAPIVEQAATCTDPVEARRCRIALRNLRCAAEKTRKGLKEESLLRGKVIDGASAIFVLALKPAEDAMDAIEKAEQIAEAKRVQDLLNARYFELEPYCDPKQFIAILGTLPEPAYQNLLAGQRAAWLAAKAAEAEAKAAAEAEAKAAAEAEELKRLQDIANEAALKAENERLAKLAADAEAKAKAEREAADAEAARAKAEADAQRRADALESARLAAIADDRIHQLGRWNTWSHAELRVMSDADFRQALDDAGAKQNAADAEAAKVAADKAESVRLAGIERAAQNVRDAENARIFAELRADNERIAQEQAATQARLDAEATARRKAMEAPDKEKLLALADTIRALPVGTYQSDRVRKLSATIIGELNAVADRIVAAAEHL